MSRKRAVVKYTALGVLTANYAVAVGLTMQRTRKQESTSPVSKERVAIVGAAMLGLTWLATLL